MEMELLKRHFATQTGFAITQSDSIKKQDLNDFMFQASLANKVECNKSNNEINNDDNNDNSNDDDHFVKFRSKKIYDFNEVIKISFSPNDNDRQDDYVLNQNSPSSSKAEHMNKSQTFTKKIVKKKLSFEEDLELYAECAKNNGKNAQYQKTHGTYSWRKMTRFSPKIFLFIYMVVKGY